MSEDDEPLHATVPADAANRRLDQVLPELFSDYSRARLQQWVKAGRVLVDGAQWRQRDRVCGGEQVRLTPTMTRDEDWQAEAIPLTILHEDAHVLVIDKPAGMVVHPGAGNPGGTLLNALLHHDADLATLPRAGIVHRIDKDTSGLLVVARSSLAHKHLVAALKEKTVRRGYDAICIGVMTAGGHVDAPIGRHPSQRTRMAVVNSGKPAVTHYRVSERFRAHTLIRASLETGRTHQIRVHMAHLRYPLLGDPQYGGRVRLPPACDEATAAAIQGFRRQALHAAELAFIHPASAQQMHFHSLRPDDLVSMLKVLADDRDQHRD